MMDGHVTFDFDEEPTGYEGWEFYQCHLDNQPASFVVNLTYADAAPVKDATELSWLIIRLNQPREDGLSSDEEFDNLCAIDDALIAALEDSELAFHYVGGYTSEGMRRYYIYSNNGRKVKSILERAIKQIPNYEYQSGHKIDATWSAYLDFIFPSEREWRLISNRKVIDVLEKNNDLLDVPRNVRHWAYFSDVEARSTFLMRSKVMGFALDYEVNPNGENDRWGCVLIRKDPVNYSSMAEVTLPLFDLAKELGGEYDGWETKIVRDASQEETS